MLKGVSLKPLSVEVDESWIRSALASASNPDYCLIDSGATNALRPAVEEELREGRAIRVDLASGVTELRINNHGTLLHAGPCQVILPASYLIQLGFSIVWRQKGCRIKHPKKGCLEVTVVKGCPLVSREIGLLLLKEYEERQAGEPVLSKAEVQDLVEGLPRDKAREWLSSRLLAKEGQGLSEVDQLVFLKSVFPRVPLEVLGRVCVPALNSGLTDWAELPWNRRFRRSIFRSSPGAVLVSVSPHPQSWKGLGRVISVSETERGLGSRLVFQLLMRWAELGLVGGLVWSDMQGYAADEGTSVTGRTSFSWDLQDLDALKKGKLVQGSVTVLRLFLLFSVAQAAQDMKDLSSDGCELGGEHGTSGSEPRGLLVSRSTGLACEAGGSRARDRSRVFLACCLPRDPLSDPSSVNTDEGWDLASVSDFAKMYDIYRADFDQGCFGRGSLLPCPAFGIKPQGDVVPSGVHVPSCPTSGPNPQGDVVPLGVLSHPPGEDAPACEKLAYEAMSHYPSGSLSPEAVFRVLSQTPEVLPARTRGARTDASHQWFSGGYGHGPMVGVRNSTLRFPWTTALACRYVREKAPWHRFGAVAFTVNLLSEAHVDSHNDASSYNLLLPLTAFSRGGLWVADDNGSDVMHVRGSRRAGTVHSFDSGAICFNPRVLHSTERWEGTRAVLVAYTPGGLEKLEAEDQAVLAELGFVCSEPTTETLAQAPVRFSLEFGVRRSPEEFVAEACKAEHPSSFENLLPAELDVAVRKNFEMSEHTLGQHRTEMIRKWIARANDLVPQEELLKKDMSTNRQSILASKRLMLFKSLLEEAGHADNELCDDLAKGFDLVGRLPESRVFKKKFRPATMLEDDLREDRCTRAYDSL